MICPGQFSYFGEHTARFAVRLVALGAVALVGGLANGTAFAQQPTAIAGPATCVALLDHTVPRLQDDAPQSLCQYSGKVLLIVNTASFCGYTPQYEGLEALQKRYAARGLVVMGFPSNDFKQEPKGNKEIADFCFDTYGVKFPMFAKTTVVGPNAHPIYKQLAAATGQPPRWNFHKYLVDRKGQVIASLPSKVEPNDKELIQRIEKLLDAS
jgi:glutathione peroxidase